MEFILAQPMAVRLAVLFVIGVCLGSAVNLAIYRLSWYPRSISPWSRPDPVAPPRRLWDRIPILGWLGLRREASLHGSGFWIRPMLSELFCGLGLAGLYWWEIGPVNFQAAQIGPPLPQMVLDFIAALHHGFAVHVILIALMLAGSMIDIDEKIIPDEITVSGTLIGLLLAIVWPDSRLLDVSLPGQVGVRFLNLASPHDLPAVLNGAPNTVSLALALACVWAWCVAILPRTWYTRHGWRRAIELCVARVVRTPVTRRIVRMGLFASAVTAVVWYQGGSSWEALLSALVGMAASGGLVWLVRVAGTAVLNREAMGFGDVTLLAMIGAFLGWQPCLVIFFLAPFAGLVVGVLRLMLFRDKEIPYGPFICLATLLVILYWPAIWIRMEELFAIGWLVPMVMLVCPMLLALMLGAWRLILSVFR